MQIKYFFITIRYYWPKGIFTHFGSLLEAQGIFIVMSHIKSFTQLIAKVKDVGHIQRNQKYILNKILVCIDYFQIKIIIMNL